MFRRGLTEYRNYATFLPPEKYDNLIDLLTEFFHQHPSSFSVERVGDGGEQVILLLAFRMS